MRDRRGLGLGLGLAPLLDLDLHLGLKTEDLDLDLLQDWFLWVSIPYKYGINEWINDLWDDVRRKSPNELEYMRIGQARDRMYVVIL